MPVKRMIVCLLVIALGLSPLGCRLAAVREAAASSKPRIQDPQLAQSDLASLVQGNSMFAFDLYQALRLREGNLFCSPYSISLALAMTFAGARGETEAQIADTLRFVLGQGLVHQAFNCLDQLLAGRGEGAEGKDGEGFRLHIVNAVWGQRDYQFLESFLDVLAENYGAGIRLLDFVQDPEGSRKTINDWVSRQTEGRIEDLLAEGTVDVLTRMVLTNAIYFNAAWQNPFDEQATSDGAFRLLDGGEVSVPMMHLTENLRHARGDGYQAVELPYDGGELSMVVLLPDEGRFDRFEESLDAAGVAAALDGLADTRVRLSMPKFRCESEFSLKDTLSAMGMPVAFSDAADFSGMTGNRELAISEVVHKAFVEVDEAGTEAAAATAVVMRLTAAPGEPLEVRIDRPFVFFIRDVETGAVLFVGRVVNPA